MRRLHRRGRGQALVEFALIVPLFILILLAVFDLGRGVFMYTSITNAAREAARLAIVNQDVTDHPGPPGRAVGCREDQPTATAPTIKVEFFRADANGNPDTSRPCPTPVDDRLSRARHVRDDVQPITPIVEADPVPSASP